MNIESIVLQIFVTYAPFKAANISSPAVNKIAFCATGRYYKPIFTACCFPAKHEIHKQPRRARLQKDTQIYILGNTNGTSTVRLEVPRGNNR